MAIQQLCSRISVANLRIHVPAYTKGVKPAAVSSKKNHNISTALERSVRSNWCNATANIFA